MARARVHEVLPAALRDGTLHEGREVEAVFEVDPAILGHSGHLLLVDATQGLPLQKHIDEEAAQTDHFRGVAADLQQGRDVHSKLLLLEARLVLLLLLGLHLKFLLEIDVVVTAFRLEAFHVDLPNALLLGPVRVEIPLTVICLDNLDRVSDLFSRLVLDLPLLTLVLIEGELRNRLQIELGHDEWVLY